MNRYKNHQILIENFKRMACEEFVSEIRIFDRITGQFYARIVRKGMIEYIPLKFNKNGQADMYAIFVLNIKGIKIPIHLEIEAKSSDNAKLNKDQEHWRDFCKNTGILWFELRDAEKTISEIRYEINKIVKVLSDR